MVGIAGVRLFLKKWDKDILVQEFDSSSATVDEAAQTLGVSGPEIAKSVSLYRPDGSAIVVVVSGNHKIDSKKFKEEFGFKARMLSLEDVERLTGHPVGGVCPFALNPGVAVYLDESLKSFDTVYPACGSSNSAIALTIPELEEISGSVKWVDVTKV